MVYNYCGIVFKSEVVFPFFFEDAVNIPDFEIIRGECDDCFENCCLTVFCRDHEYILNFGKYGYYEISKNHIVFHFKDIAYMYATICNLPFAIVSILRGMIPCHSSSIKLSENKVVLFLGEKGTGKTTIACLTDNYDLGTVYGDDMVTICKIDDHLEVNRGSKMMKVTPDTASMLDTNRISEEVYPGLNKNYYVPKNGCLKHSSAQLHKVILLERGRDIACKRIPAFLYKPTLVRNIVGISMLDSFFLHTINEILNSFSNFEIYKLHVPNNLEKLKLRMPDIISTVKDGG